ncbi:hypothetical protein J4Q44_G00200930 [Coregonus suidteri]|uniref:Leucine-rich repeat flightless-interacting protein 1 n=1 Tax=Coregonus suidteri TaxID=861788 RepID=A0AAN8LL12_9TELE
MGTQGTGRKRNPNKDRSTAEDDALNLIAREAEARLALKRAARAEAREIRMKELERQQKESYQVQKKYYGLDSKLDNKLDNVDSEWGHITQWMEDSERYSRPSQRHTLISDDDEQMSVGSRGSVRSFRLSDESTSRVSRSSRLDLQLSSRLTDESISRVSHSSRLDLQPPSEYSSYRGISSRAFSKAISDRASPVDDDRSSVASFLRSTATGSSLPRDLVCLLCSQVEDDLEKGSRAASTLSAATLALLGRSSSRRGSGETSITGDTETSILEIKEIHELTDQIQDVESKYMQSLKEVKDSLVEVEEKYRKAMVSNAQLDNEKNNLMYQVDTLKDSLMELEELLSESRREYEGKTKDFEREKHAHGVLQFQFNVMKEKLKQSEELLTEIHQLRLKQDNFVREISDLQETVEWKDKKIGALERQKEYLDAIRNERDELRDEVVQLKDILKKHGIVLGPDLTTNGEKVKVGTERSTSRDPASQLAQDSQTSPTEGGNIMLGRAQEMELGSRGDKVVDPGRSRQQVETHEAVQENHLTSPTSCSLAGVSETKASMEALPFSPKLGDEVEIESSNVNKDSDNGIPVVEVKQGPVCDSEVIVVVTGPEEEVTGEGEGYEPAGIEGTGQGRVEATNKWEMGIKNDKVDDMETKVTKSSDHTKETSSKEPTSEYGAVVEQRNIASSKEVLKSIDSCPQPRETIEDTMKNGTQISQGTDHDTSKSPIKSKDKSQPKPQKTKKAEVLPETTDMQPQAQGGKKKRKKGKKGGTQGDEKQGDDNKKSKTEKDVDSILTDKEPVAELVEGGIIIETQQLLEEGTGSSPDRELQSLKEKVQTIAEEGWNLKEEQQLAEDRVEVKCEEPPIETPEVSLIDQAKTDPKCPLDLKESTAGNSNNVKEEDAIKVSVEEAQTIQDTKKQGINFHNPIVLRPELEKSMVPEDLIANDGVTTHPDHVTENAIKDLKAAVADKHLDENNKPETLDGENASNGGISTETELNDTETRLQDPVEETPETIDSFREQGHNESRPCTMVAEAEEQDDPTEANLEVNKVPGPSEQGNDEEGNDDIDEEGQSFDFDDLDLVVSAKVFPVKSQEEVSQEVRMMIEGDKIEVEPGREKANKEEEDGDKSTGKPQGTVEGVSTIVAKQPLEGGSDGAPE